MAAHAQKDHEFRVVGEQVQYEGALLEAAFADERITVLTAENRAAIRSLPQALGERFIDVGICEQTMIGVAAGLALRGRIPVAHALASFLTMRAFEFIRTDIGIVSLPVKLVGSFAGFMSEANGPTHQALEDVALMRGIPHVNVWCPADRQELVLGLKCILLAPEPYYIRFNDLDPVVDHDVALQPGVAEVLAEGQDVTLLTYGFLFKECFLAAQILRGQGYAVGLVNMRTLKPVDRERILCVAASSSLMVVVEDHFKCGGLYSIVAEILAAEGLGVRLHGISFDERWFRPGLLPQVTAYERFDATGIAEQVCRTLGSP